MDIDLNAFMSRQRKRIAIQAEMRIRQMRAKIEKGDTVNVEQRGYTDGGGGSHYGAGRSDGYVESLIDREDA